MHLKDMREYTAAVINNNSDELLQASFICERAHLKNDDGQCRSMLEGAFMNRMKMYYLENEEIYRASDIWVRQVATEQLNTFG
jgi:hypothetical protein